MSDYEAVFLQERNAHFNAVPLKLAPKGCNLLFVKSSYVDRDLIWEDVKETRDVRKRQWSEKRKRGK